MNPTAMQTHHAESMNVEIRRHGTRRNSTLITGIKAYLEMFTFLQQYPMEPVDEIIVSWVYPAYDSILNVAFQRSACEITDNGVLVDRGGTAWVTRGMIRQCKPGKFDGQIVLSEPHFRSTEQIFDQFNEQQVTSHIPH